MCILMINYIKIRVYVALLYDKVFIANNIYLYVVCLVENIGFFSFQGIRKLFFEHIIP